MTKTQEKKLLKLIQNGYSRLKEIKPSLPLQVEDIVNNNDVASGLLTVLGMLSFKAAINVLEYFFGEIEKAYSNGHVLHNEGRKSKHHNVANFDHHSPEPTSESHELGWGLFCATLMTALGSYLQLFGSMASLPIPVGSEDEVGNLIHQLRNSATRPNQIKQQLSKILAAAHVTGKAAAVLEDALFELIQNMDPEQLSPLLQEIFQTPHGIDADQWLASMIVLLSAAEAIDIEQYLNSQMTDFLAEEFGIFANGLKPINISAPGEHLIRSLNKKNGQEFEMPNFSAQVLVPPTNSKNGFSAPIVIIETQLSTLPIKGGLWNHIIADIVERVLRSHGLLSYLETGVVTWVMHGEKQIGQERSAYNKTYKHVFDAMSARPERSVIGLISKNNMPWHEQYRQNESGIQTHESLARLFLKHFPANVARNLLVISNKPPHQQGIQHKLKSVPIQHGISEVLKVLQEVHGYTIGEVASV